MIQVSITMGCIHHWSMVRHFKYSDRKELWDSIISYPFAMCAPMCPMLKGVHRGSVEAPLLSSRDLTSSYHSVQTVLLST